MGDSFVPMTERDVHGKNVALRRRMAIVAQTHAEVSPFKKQRAFLEGLRSYTSAGEWSERLQNSTFSQHGFRPKNPTLMRDAPETKSPPGGGLRVIHNLVYANRKKYHCSPPGYTIKSRHGTVSR